VAGAGWAVDVAMGYESEVAIDVGFESVETPGDQLELAAVD
jgi:hypothetical protein